MRLTQARVLRLDPRLTFAGVLVLFVGGAIATASPCLDLAPPLNVFCLGAAALLGSIPAIMLASDFLVFAVAPGPLAPRRSETPGIVGFLAGVLLALVGIVAFLGTSLGIAPGVSQHYGLIFIAGYCTSVGSLWFLSGTYKLAPQRRPSAADYFDSWRKSVYRGVAAFQEGRFADAETLSKAALESEATEDDEFRQRISLNNLAATYCAQGQYGAAIPLYGRLAQLQALELEEQNPGLKVEELELASTLLKLAAAYRLEGRLGEAAPIAAWASVIFADTGVEPDDPKRIRAAIGYFGQLYDAAGGRVEAESPAGRAPEVRDQLTQDRLAEAAVFRRDPAWIVGSLTSLESPDLAQQLRHLAEVYRSEGMPIQAERFYQWLTAIRLTVTPEKVLRPETPEFARALDKLAEAYRGEGGHAEAEWFLKRAQAIRAKHGTK